jgi:hypothetical protein
MTVKETEPQVKQINSEQQKLVNRLIEVGIGTRHFFPLAKGTKNPDGIRATDFPNHLHTPEEMIQRKDVDNWGICGKDGLVLIDCDKKELYDLLSKALPETFEVISPRRGLPHKYFIVEGKQVENAIFHIPNDYDEKGRLNGAGEIRSKNEYLVASGTIINYMDKTTNEQKIGMYSVSNDQPITRIKYEDFMKAVTPFIGCDSKQKLTKEDMQKGVAEGNRHAKGIQYATYLLGTGHLDKEMALSALQFWNLKNNPPMNDEDLVRMIDNASGYVVDDLESDSETEEKLSREWEPEDLERVLNQTIKGDYTLKMILFLSSLLAFTDHEQVGIIITGSTSTGKSFNIDKILWFFPPEYKEEFQGATTKSFIHQKGKSVDIHTLKTPEGLEPPKKGDSEYEQKNILYHQKLNSLGNLLDYEKKIVVFPDMNDTELLKTLRSVLSHDQKVCKYITTERTRNGYSDKTTLIKGFFVCITATASTWIDDQEASRNFLLSTEDDEEKILNSVKMITRKNTDSNFSNWYEHEESRVVLKSRVRAIADFNCEKITIPQNVCQELEDWYLKRSVFHSPKIFRDYTRMISLVKAWTLFNWRNRSGNKEKELLSTSKDVKVAISLYEKILDCNSLGLSQEEFEIWLLIKDIAVDGIKLSAIHSIYANKKKRAINDHRLRNFLKNFVRSGLLREDREGKNILYYSIKIPVDDQTPTDDQGQPIERFIR